MEASSIVSRARTAFHSAAAKAERVFFSDIKKSDSSTDQVIHVEENLQIDSAGEDSERNSTKVSNSESPNNAAESTKHRGVKYLTRKPAPIKTKRDWHERLKNIRIGKKEAEEKEAEDPEKAGNPTMAFAIFDENLYLTCTKAASQRKVSEIDSSLEHLSNNDIIPPASVVKQLAIAVEAGKKFKSMKDILASSRDSSPVRERAFSAVKSLVLREKEEKFTAELGGGDKVHSLINSLLDTEGQFPGGKIGFGSDSPKTLTSLPKDIHGVPLQSLVVKLSEVIGSFKTLQKMALFWYKFVAELRRLWSEGQYVPGIPPDETPDLNSCLLHQQLQVINCCISRKRRRFIASESLESIIGQTSPHMEESANSEGTGPVNPVLYARISTGELIIRLGADKQSDNLTMLETGEPIYIPVVQEAPLLTEDVIKETEEFVLRTGSVGAGCSRLLSDMQAFKAANPGCILEDFVRWHSPPDWMELEQSGEAENASNDGDLCSARGQLSSRMQKEGNLWREFWETSKPVPAVNQVPLYDEDLAVEGIMNDFEDITPSKLFEQLFVSLLGSGFVIGEEKLSTNSSLSKLFFECKGYIIATCQSSTWTDKLDDICQVYETVEIMLLKPEEALTIIKNPEENANAGEPRRRFRRLSDIFGNKDKHLGTPAPKDQKNCEDNSTLQSFSSLFSRKPPRPDQPSPSEKPVCSIENDWTVV